MGVDCYVGHLHHPITRDTNVVFENKTSQLGMARKVLDAWTARSKTHRTNVAMYHNLGGCKSTRLRLGTLNPSDWRLDDNSNSQGRCHWYDME